MTLSMNWNEYKKVLKEASEIAAAVGTCYLQLDSSGSLHIVYTNEEIIERVERALKNKDSLPKIPFKGANDN